MSKLILLSNREKIITNEMDVSTYPSYSFVRYFIGDDSAIDEEFYRLQKKFGLKFFSFFIINQQTKTKYYFSSDSSWNDYYIKHNLINYDHLYKHAFSVMLNTTNGVATLIYWDSCPILTKEAKDVDIERKMRGKYSNGYGVAYKKGKYFEVSGFGGAVEDKLFSVKMPVNETQAIVSMVRRLMIGL